MAKYSVLFLMLLLLMGCRQAPKSGQLGKNSSAATNTASQHVNTQVTYNLFIENSPSMDGYVAGNNTKFKNILGGLVSSIEILSDIKPVVSFINQKPYPQAIPINEPVSSFIRGLTPQKLGIYCNKCDTQIDAIINQCMNGLDSNINILTSDCIFSQKQNRQIASPDKAKDALKTAIGKRLHSEQITLIVLKYNSDYTGQYFSESNNDKPIKLEHSINRPFYILLFGKEGNLLPMLSKINLRYPGFEAGYCLVPNQNGASISTAVSTQNRMGNFSFQKPASAMVIYDASPNNDGVFQFSINADLSHITAEKGFLLNPSNYSITDGNFKIISIEPYSGSDSDYTHVITLQTKDLQQNHDITLGIKYEPPVWVNATGSLMDNNPYDTAHQQHQTYGFASLMEGISQGYTAKNGDWQFSINVKISKGKTGAGASSAGFPWWILIAVAAVVGVIIWLKNKS